MIYYLLYASALRRIAQLERQVDDLLTLARDNDAQNTRLLNLLNAQLERSDPRWQRGYVPPVELS